MEVLANAERIHQSFVRKSYKDAHPPLLKYGTINDKTVEIIYDSPRKLCSFALGIIDGFAKHFKENVKVTQPMCMLKNDKACHIVVTKRS